MNELSTITVGELNVQGAKWKRKENDQIKKQVVDIFERLKNAPAVIEQKCQDASKSLDVIVLTEVCNAQREIIQKFDEYEWIVSNNGNRTNRYSVVIGVKKSFLSCILEATLDKSTDDIDLLGVCFKSKNGKTICVVGCRMTTGLPDRKKQYDSEREIFDNQLLPFICNSMDSDVCIVAGDFNNAYCRGDLNEKFNPKDYEGKAQINYNLNIIKDKFVDDLGFKMLDIGDGYGKPTWSEYEYGEKYIPDDHIFVRGLASEDRVGTIPTDKLSDHDALIAMFNIDAE